MTCKLQALPLLATKRHMILLTIARCKQANKLGVIGVGEDYLPLFAYYMNCCKQHINIDGFYSTVGEITLGVPQGSFLGPILFSYSLTTHLWHYRIL